MKRNSYKLIISILLIMVVSCDDPETIVTNYVHPDGSVTRKIEMRSSKNSFKISEIQIPFDSTWIVKDSIELNEKGDTTWVKRGEKLFKNIEEINLAYKTDSGANRNVSRKALFVKKFKWFNTEFRFSESIDKTLSFGYPVNTEMNSEELLWFYSPEGINHEKETGPDSVRYRILKDSVNVKSDRWTIKNLVSEWIGEFVKLTEDKPGGDSLKKSLLEREDQFANLIKIKEKDFDSLWTNGIILKEYLGETNYQRYKTDADTAIERVTRNLFIDFKGYSERIVMPGKLTGTNGFIDSSIVLLWPVKSDYFMTEPYEMWAESKLPNRWAWIVSGVFLLFVIAGVIIRGIKKG
jgi:hypothetical protein